MADLTNWFANLSITDPAFLSALGAGALCIALFLLFGRRKSGEIVGSNTVDDGSEEYSTNWLPPSKRTDERRRSPRRAGVPTPIRMMDAATGRKPLDAYVLDRSSGGLRVAVDRPCPAGSIMQVRPTHAPTETPWIPLIVRSCREVGDHFELGCQFDQDLPWNLLLLFG